MAMSKSEKIGIVGLWHLGSVLCAAWSKLGYDVIGYDNDKQRVNDLSKGIPPVFEPNLNDTILSCINKGNLSFSSDLQSLNNCDFIFMSYDTPVRDDDSSDLTILEKSVKEIRKVMKNDTILIVSSQSPVGYCTTLRSLLKDENKTLELAYSPENLRLGEAIHCYLNPGRIILGTSHAETERKCISLFSNITNKILSMNIPSAEMVKHGINSFLSTSIVFANSLADVCEESGANIDDVVKGLKSDPRIGQKAYLSPGIGFSGGTLGRDLKVLDKFNKSISGPAEMFGFIHETNLKRKTTIVKKIIKLINGTKDKTVGILGLTYKPGTSTLRRSLPLEIVDLLINEGVIVKVFDPKADYAELSFEPQFIITKSIVELSENTDIIVLLTEWPEFKEFDWESISSKMNTSLFFDTKNFLNQNEMKTIGFEYYSTGKS